LAFHFSSPLPSEFVQLISNTQPAACNCHFISASTWEF
jgi:hypothetical protein